MSGAIISHRGNFNRTTKFFKRMIGQDYLKDLKKYGDAGVESLSVATPVDSGETAQCWNYDIKRDRDNTIISWFNTNENDGVNIAILLQYGHATGTGGYVPGRDYVNPAMRPVLDKMTEEAWKGVIVE